MIMPLIPMRVLLDHAAENDYGVGAFNVNNMEQIQAIMMAATETNSPVIIQASRGARAYSNDNYLRHLMLAAAELNPQIPVAMHLDHGNSPETCFSAIEQGFTSVMMDGSLEEPTAKRQPATSTTSSVTKAWWTMIAHLPAALHRRRPRLGVLGSLETGTERRQKTATAPEARTSPHDQLLTDPEEAVRFVADTKVAMRWPWPWAPAHGAYKFTRKKPDGDVLAMNVIEEINQPPAQHAPGHAWVISQRAAVSFRTSSMKYGGQPEPDIRACRSKKSSAASSTACARSTSIPTTVMAITGAIRKVFAEQPEKFDPRDYLKPARVAMAEVVKARMIAFGQAGWADKVPVVTLDEMKSRY
jgi:fructose-bisphosphate aldolase class II